MFNLILSVLPRPLLRVVRTLGFKADREQGLKWLEVTTSKGSILLGATILLRFFDFPGCNNFSERVQLSPWFCEVGPFWGETFDA